MFIAKMKLLYGYRFLQLVPSGGRHAEVYRWLRKFARDNQDALYELVFSELPKRKELYSLIFLGSHGGSVGYEYNSEWHDFIARVRVRQNEFPDHVQRSLSWLLQTHRW